MAKRKVQIRPVSLLAKAIKQKLQPENKIKSFAGERKKIIKVERYGEREESIELIGEERV